MNLSLAILLITFMAEVIIAGMWGVVQLQTMQRTHARRCHTG